MAQYRLNAYDADVFIPEFKGLMQYGDQMGDDLRFSPDCMNVETTGGVLQPAPLLQNVKLYGASVGGVPQQISVADVCTMMYARVTNLGPEGRTELTTIYYTHDGVESSTTVGNEVGKDSDVYFIITGAQVWMAKLPVDIETQMASHKPWTLTGIQMNGRGQWFNEDEVSWCTYEVNYPESEDDYSPVGRTNVIVYTSKLNGTRVFDGHESSQISSPAPQNLRYVARYADRIWGVGSGISEKDSDVIYYSRPYSCTDWSQDDDDPANGGGEIREATFDNDRILALVPFGDSLIAFSEQRAWKITGSDPSNFIIQEQYGNGTMYPKSIAVVGNRIIMLGEHGLVSYDGYQVSPFMKEATYEIFRGIEKANQVDINKPPFTSPVAIATKDKYILSLGNRLRYENSSLTNNNYFYLVYNEMDGTIVPVESPYILNFCSQFPDAWALVYSGANNQYVSIAKLRFDSWYLNDTFQSKTKWMTPWVTFGRKDIQKGGFELYLYPELKRPADSTAEGVTFKITVETEKKRKIKYYRALYNSDGKYKQKRLHFGGAGRRFRVTIETGKSADGDDETNLPLWRLIGGIHIIAETDKD